MGDGDCARKRWTREEKKGEEGGCTARSGAAVEGSERVELATGEHTVPGQRWAVIDWFCSQVDPKVAILGGPWSCLPTRI
jgi:hypothetical protein